ncbi:MAG: pyruvate kinase [Candidatus Latescibacterota bacterium]
MRKTKIVCTIGPASSSEKGLRALMDAGMDVARLNFSHGTQAEHGRVIALIRKLSEERGRPVGILQDLCGPKIRVGALRSASVMLDKGDRIVLTSTEVSGDAHRIGVSYARLAEDIHPGEAILINDGAIALEVRSREGDGLVCVVKRGGELLPGKGVNFPESQLGVEALTPKDREDLLFGVAQGVDWVALSFVRRPEDVSGAKELLRAHGADTPVIAKIEKREALDCLDEIVAVSDGVMVARGDLGVEAALEEVPLAQKRIIALCNRMGKPVITATQMLESMREHPYPTRAEVSDVANAILDGTDAVMLSQETAIGDFPAESVRMMARVAEKTETALEVGGALFRRRADQTYSVSDAISHATCSAAADLEVAAIITATMSGSTARMVARYRPRAPILAVSPNRDTRNRLCLSWGVVPMPLGHVSDTDEMVAQSVETALGTGLVARGDRVILTAGIPLEQTGTTNLLRVYDIPEKPTGAL